MKGRLVKRSKVSWTIIIEAGRDPATGKRKRIYKAVRGNKTQAKQVMEQLLAELQQGTYVKPEKITLAEYLNEWLETACKPRLAPKTIEGYKICIERHITPALGQIYLSELQPMHIQILYGDLLEKGLSKRTVELVHTVLRAALKQAVKWQMISRNPADATEPPRPKRPEVRTLSPAELNRLLEEAQSSPIADVILVAAYTGMRRGEVLALQWEDIDFVRRIIYVQRNLVRVGGEFIVKPPKTQRGLRQVPVDDGVIERLAELKEQAISKWVFSRADGSPLDPSTVTHQFKRVAEQAGFPDLRFHDLRHTFATILLTQGIQAKVVQELLGHESITTTIDTYTHVVESLQKQAANAFGNALKREENLKWRQNGGNRHLRLVQ